MEVRSFDDEGASDQHYGHDTDTAHGPDSDVDYEYHTFGDPFGKAYRHLVRAQRVLELASLVCLAVAFCVWGIVWYRNRTRPAYRYAFLLFVIGTNLVFMASHYSIYSHYVSEMTNELVLFSLTGHACLSMIRALKKTVKPGQVLVCIMVCIVPALLLTLLRWRLQISIPSLSLTALNVCALLVPTFLALLAGLIVTGVLLYWLFALDNSRYKENRDYRVIRYGTVCLLLAIIYCTSLEIGWIVLAGTSDHVLTSMMLVFVFYSARGMILSILLCFLDLEVLAQWACGCVLLDDHEDEKELKDEAGDAPGIQEGSGKGHVSFFESEGTPPLNAQTKQLYGTYKESP